MKTISTLAIIEGVRSRKDRSLGLTISTPELSVTEKAIFLEMQGINVELQIRPLDEAPTGEYQVDKELEQKTPSQRQRAVFFLLWRQDPENESDFDTYYRHKMEKIIEYLKSKLEE